MNLTAHLFSIVSLLLLAAVPVPFEAKTLRGLQMSDGLGDQRCKGQFAFEEYWDNRWVERPLAPGTQCCPYLDGSKKIIPTSTALAGCPTNTPTDSPTDFPSDAPTNTPTDSPTDFPSDAPSASCPASWTPLAGATNAIKLANISECDDCVEEVDLGFNFKWLGGTSTISKVHVSSNGQILINPGDDDTSWYRQEIGDNDKPRIAVAQEDMDSRTFRGNNGGNVYLKTFPGFAIISFEMIRFFPYKGRGINAQAHLFADGRVNICYGTGRIDYSGGDDDCFSDSIAAGIEGGENDDVYAGSEGAVVAPLPGNPFNSRGVATVWPTANSCYCFSPSTKTWFV